MEKDELPKLYKRDWLNEDEGSAYIIIDASLAEDWKTTDGRQLEASVQFKDCNRQIDLEFSPWKAEDNDKYLRKLQLIIDRLEELKAFMVANPTIDGKIKKDRKAANPVQELLEELEEESTDAGKADD
jgi:hypothetical protein